MKIQTSKQKQRIVNGAQFKLDNLDAYPDESKEELESQLLQNMSDDIEKEIIEDAANYGDLAIEAMINYLNNEYGVPDDIMIGFKNAIDDTLNRENSPFYEFINASIRFEAEKQAKELI